MSGLQLVRRLLQVIPTVLGILLVSFVLVHLAPGDPIVALAGEHGDAEYYAFMRQRFGLDQPLPQQFLAYLRRAAAGDLGFSYVYGRSTIAVIGERLPATLLLTGSALLLAIAAAIPLAVLAARRSPGAVDSGISGVALGLYSMPAFWIGQLAVLGFAYHLGLFPVEGMSNARSEARGWPHVLDVARHLALPALVLAVHEMAALLRVTRSSLLQVLRMEHVRTARAKGLPYQRVLWRHALPHALIPVISVVGGRVGQLLTGAAVVEIVFGWPGIGRLMLAGMQARDIPVLLSLFTLTALTVTFANLLTDLLQLKYDARIQAA